MKKIILCICLILFQRINLDALEQKNSFSINSYNPCNNSVELEKSDEISTNDLIFIIQMNGAIIDRSNTEKYGDIVNLNGAGQFELNEVLSVKGNSIQFKFQLKEGYDFSSAVQFIKVPRVKNLTISKNPDVQAWDGKTGGVLVLFAEDTLTLETDIDVSGKGFRGGVFNKVGDWDMSESDYFYEIGTHKAGYKGEGIVNYNDKYIAGMGKNANGGGGGNAADAGGGGGGNWASGGNGGYPGNFEKLTRTYKEMGKGGKLSGNITNLFPVILGGGGGGGSTNHNLGTGGVSGGGIVFVFAKYLNGNERAIISNGSDVQVVSGTDGSGGGGGGGSAFLFFEKVINKINIELKGGTGGNTDARGLDGVVQKYCHGPGGGGGGGTLFLNKESIFIQSILYGGKSGIKIAGNDTCSGTSYGAEDGEMGKRIVPTFDTKRDTIKPIYFNFVLNSIGTCRESINNLSIEPKDSIKQILWNNGESENNIEINAIGNYYAEIIDLNGCTHFLDTNITELNLNNSNDNTDVFNSEKFTFSGTPNPLPKGLIITENKSNAIGAIWQIEKLNLTKDFTTSFGFRVYNGFNNFMFEKSYPGADGFALIFQNSTPNPIGNNGGGIGYTGIPNSLAIELDLFGNYLNLDSIFDPNGNHLAIFSNKDKPNISNHKSDALISEKQDIIEILGDSTIYFFNVDYINKKLRVSVSKDSLDFSNSIEIENFDFSKYISLDQKEYSFIGISSATGTAVQTHEILNWSLCGDTKLINTSIEDETDIGEMLFYPNPVENILKLNNNLEFKSIKIIDLIGNVVFEKQTNENINEVNLEELNSGMYFIELIEINDQVNFSKFIKK